MKYKASIVHSTTDADFHSMVYETLQAPMDDLAADLDSLVLPTPAVETHIPLATHPALAHVKRTSAKHSKRKAKKELAIRRDGFIPRAHKVTELLDGADIHHLRKPVNAEEFPVVWSGYTGKVAKFTGKKAHQWEHVSKKVWTHAELLEIGLEYVPWDGM
jgi:hypothetical protein